MRIFTAACLLMVLALPAVAGELSKEDRLLVLGASAEKVHARLNAVDDDHRRALYRAMAAYPEMWAGVFLERLDDRVRFPVGALKKGLEAGAVDPELATERLEEHHRSPHAFVRIRAANVLLVLDRERAIRWLKEELRTRRTWDRVSYRNCDGTTGGLEGWIERLTNPPVDPYDTVGETEVVPADRWRVEVLCLPFRVLLRNAGGDALLRLPNLTFGKTLHWRSSLGLASGIGGGSRGGSHSRLVQTIEPGEIAFATTVELSEKQLAALAGVELSFRFTRPGRRAARTSVTVPAKALRPVPDLEAWRVGASHPDRSVRHEFLDLFTAHGRRDLVVPPELRRGLVEALVGLAEAMPPPAETEPVFFHAETGGPTIDVAPIEGLKRFREDLVAKDFDRLLRLRNARLVRHLRVLSGAPGLEASIRRALAETDPLVIRNLALLHADPGMPADADLSPAVGRWLRSEEPPVFRAGLYVLSRSRIEPEGWTAAITRALTSGDPRIVRAGVYTRSRRAPGLDRRLLDLYGTTEHESVRIAVLDAIADECRARYGPEDVAALRAFILPLLPLIGESGEEGIRVCRIVARDARVVEVETLVRVWRETGDRRLLRRIAVRRHDFGSPVLARLFAVRKSGFPFRGSLREDLIRLELDRPGDADPEAHYTELLTRALYSGNARRAAAACLPLAHGEGVASLRALDTATGSDDDLVVECAEWGLAARDPERPRPEVEEEDEDG